MGTKEDLEKFADFWKNVEIPDFLVGISPLGKDLHIDDEAFRRMFGDNCKVSERDREQYPYEFSTILENGVKVFAISRRGLMDPLQ